LVKKIVLAWNTSPKVSVSTFLSEKANLYDFKMIIKQNLNEIEATITEPLEKHIHARHV